MIKIYALIVPLLFALDMLWLGVVMKDFYQTRLSHLLSADIVWSAAIVFYFIFSAGLMFFVVEPGITSGSFMRTVMVGALFGFFAYATYDLTNQATLRDWPLVVTIVDIVWGAFLSAVLSGVAFLAARWLM